MATKPNGQLWVVSAAGDADSVFLRQKVDDGRARIEAGTKGRVAYFEWSLPDDMDPHDPASWALCMPALGHTVTVETIEAEHDGLLSDFDEFRRPYLGQWIDARRHDPVMPELAWGACKVEGDDETWDGTPVWSVDTAPDREWSAIGMAARAVSAGRIFGEVIKHELGTSWVVDAMVQLRTMFGGDVVVLDGAGAASSLGRDLEDEGFEVRRLSGREKVDACGALFDAVLEGKFLHLDDPVLNKALEGAVKRNVSGGDGGFMWVRGKSLQDISPLYTVTLARYVMREQLGDDYDVEKSTL